MPETFRIPKRRYKGRYERLAYARAKADRTRLPALGYRFAKDLADHAVHFVEHYLRHHEGEWAGQPFLLSTFQRFIVRELFGWIGPDGKRRFRTAYIEIARKNGKSSFAAAIALYLTIADNEDGAQVYSSATKKDQAKIVHGMAVEMLKRSPELQKFASSLRDNISCEVLGSYFRPLGADSKTLDGLNAHGHIADELHAHRTRTVYDVVSTSMGARRQPLTLIITTAGLYEPEKIGWQTHRKAQQILDGIFDAEDYFVFICAADPGDDWRKPSTWWKANPNLGTSVKWEYFVQEAERAAREPSYLNTFLRLHLNIWTRQIERWLSPVKWLACQAAAPEPELLGRPAFGGLDLSSKIDLTAFALVLPVQEDLGGGPLSTPKSGPPGDELEEEEEEEGGPWYYDLVLRFWVPGETALRRAEEDLVPYDAWIREGYIQETPGDVIDYAHIEAEISDLCDRYNVQEIAFDPWSATQSAIRLAQDGMDMVEFRQGYRSMSEPCKELEALVVAGRLRHGDHPVLNWMSNNVAVEEDPAGNIKMAKNKSTERIDGMVAVAMGLGRALVQEVEGPSVYKSRGLRAI